VLRVAFVLRSTEVHPEFCGLSSPFVLLVRCLLIVWLLIIIIDSCLLLFIIISVAFWLWFLAFCWLYREAIEHSARI
jgi:hypothetical protein